MTPFQPAKLSQRFLDAQNWRKEKRQYERVRRAEAAYGRKLRGVAQQVGDIVDAFPPGDPNALEKIKRLLRRYAEMITPWAEAAAATVLAETASRDERLWNQITKGMAEGLRREIKSAPTGQTLRRLQDEQVALIKSIPLEAAERVHKLTMEGLTSARRFEEIADDIRRTTHVTKSRATLIARTEVGRIATNLAQARAEYVGSDGYIWRTALDSDVRPSHRKMEGRFVRWDSPPTLDKLTGHAGALPNCFTGETEVDVSCGPVAVVRGWYQGPLLTFVTLDGFAFSVTPNHPIGTPRGWVAAGLLNEGDDVIQVPSKVGDAVVNNVNRKLVRFDKLFDTFCTMVEAESFGELDLYGDIIRNDVQIVGLKGHLPLDPKPGFFKSFRHHVVTGAHRWIGAAGIKGSPAQIFEAFIARGGNLLAAVLFGSKGEPPLVALAAAANGYAVLDQHLIDSRRRGSEAIGNFTGANTFQVKPNDRLHRDIFSDIPAARDSVWWGDPAFTQFVPNGNGMESNDGGGLFQKHPAAYQTCRLVHKSIRQFSGHVYTLQSLLGYYGIGLAAIITKNCRCYPEVVLPKRIV